MIPTSKLLLGLLVLAASSAEAFHPRSIDAVEFARASVVGRKREASDVDADSLLGADTPEEYSSPVSSRRRNEKEVEEGSPTNAAAILRPSLMANLFKPDSTGEQDLVEGPPPSDQLKDKRRGFEDLPASNPQPLGPALSRAPLPIGIGLDEPRPLKHPLGRAVPVHYEGERPLAPREDGAGRRSEQGRPQAARAVGLADVEHAHGPVPVAEDAGHELPAGLGPEAGVRAVDSRVGLVRADLPLDHDERLGRTVRPGPVDERSVVLF
ncbi:hypothetical protein THAOC_03448 [Thalassiosira oceanica]|uniref:RxLR effector protein n=1 Tax=Thalassiosira oceanica TaxID=159749 RepID=K0TBH7_THAOC|nr:hypothetical protein THAOC_03448 [Thalassiosira oceanica]|eukprot:EJK74855.1 hypothetical protein THAOC_03448 [Thalassiosira oceanica]